MNCMTLKTCIYVPVRSPICQKIAQRMQKNLLVYFSRRYMQHIPFPKYCIEMAKWIYIGALCFRIHLQHLYFLTRDGLYYICILFSNSSLVLYSQNFCSHAVKLFFSKFHSIHALQLAERMPSHLQNVVINIWDLSK